MHVRYEAIVIGTSAGGTQLLKSLVATLPYDFPIPLLVVQHVAPGSSGYWIETLNQLATIKVKEADEKEAIKAGVMYIAPPNYHLLVERDHTFTLTVSERVNYARPSIDVLFETASDAYKEKLVGMVLTGNNFDGAAGLKKIKENGGIAIVQAPETAEAPSMPKAAIKAVRPDYIVTPAEISNLLIEISKSNEIHPV